MRTKDNQMDDFFHKVSRMIVFVPVFIILLAVVFKLFGVGSQQKSYLQYNSLPTPTEKANIIEDLSEVKTATNSVSFSLDGPLVCEYDSKMATVSAYVLNKNVNLKYSEKGEVKRYLLKGDCFYLWKEGEYTGEKICGLSGKISIADTLLSSGLLDLNFVFDMMSESANFSPAENSEKIIQSTANTCKNEKIPVSVKFDPPKSVLFKNTTVKN